MKGVSAVISTVLVLGVAVSVAGVYAVWAPNLAENLTRTVTESSSKDMECKNAAIALQNAAWDQTGETTLFELRNAGTIRFINEIDVIALNNTRTVNTTRINNLEVEETVSASIPSKNKPERLLALSSDCPSVREEENFISTQK